MEMISVQSSQIAQIGHDGDSTLRILFRRGGLYEYAQVSREEFDALRLAPSVATHFASRVKGVKPFRKVEGSEFPEASTPPVNGHHPVVEVRSSETNSPQMEAEVNQEVERVAQKSSLVVQSAMNTKVVDVTTQIQASELLLAVAKMRKEVADTFGPMKEAAYRAHRTVCEQEKKHDGPLEQAEKALKAQIGAFVDAQKRLAREAEEAARKRAQEEAACKAREEAERRAIDDAIALEASGDAEGAEAVLANPAPVPSRYVAPAPVAPAVAHISGVTTREEWDFRIVNEALIPREYLVVNEAAIRSVVKSTKGRATIGGVEVFVRQVVASSRRG